MCLTPPWSRWILMLALFIYKSILSNVQHRKTMPLVLETILISAFCTPSPWTPHQPPCLITLHTHPNSSRPVIFTSQDVTDPVSMLKKYLLLRNHIHGAKAALFLREDSSHPSHSWFEQFFAILDRRFGGHSP
jgi:hypothetical protein